MVRNIIKTSAATILAIIAAVQLMFLGLVAVCCDSWMLGFVTGMAIPEVIRFLRKGGEE